MFASSSTMRTRAPASLILAPVWRRRARCSVLPQRRWICQRGARQEARVILDGRARAVIALPAVPQEAGSKPALPPQLYPGTNPNTPLALIRREGSGEDDPGARTLGADYSQ